MKSGIATSCARWNCNCGQEWRYVARYAGAFLPVLSPKNFILESLSSEDSPKVSINHKWPFIKNNFFQVHAIDLINIRQMCEALFDAFPEHYIKLEKQEQLAKELMANKLKNNIDKKVKTKIFLDE